MTSTPASWEARIRALDASFLPRTRFDALCSTSLGAALGACGADLKGAMVHGSTLPPDCGGKGGFVPGFSDFDFHIYLDPRRMRAAGECDVETALALQERIAPLQAGLAAPWDGGPADVGAIQLICVRADRLPPGWWLPEGTYRVVYGETPPRSRDEAPPRAQSRARLRGCRRDAHALCRSACDKTDAGLRGTVRLCASMLKGALPHAAVALGADGNDVWRWALSRLVLEVAPAAGAGDAALALWGGVADWAALRQDGPGLRRTLRAGVAALDALADLGEAGEDADGAAGEA